MDRGNTHDRAYRTGDRFYKGCRHTAAYLANVPVPLSLSAAAASRFRCHLCAFIIRAYQQPPLPAQLPHLERLAPLRLRAPPPHSPHLLKSTNRPSCLTYLRRLALQRRPRLCAVTVSVEAAGVPAAAFAASVRHKVSREEGRQADRTRRTRYAAST